MSRFDKFIAEQNSVARPNGHVYDSKQEDIEQDSLDTPEPPPPEASKATARFSRPESKKLGSVKREDDDDLSDVVDTPPPKKKRKRSPLDEDAAFAARLQAEENSRARPTRGGGPKKPAPVKKKTPRKKTAAKVRAEDDSDLDTSDLEKKVSRSGGFHVSV